MQLVRKLTSHSVFKNTLSLGVIQVANYIIPLIMLPYLLKVLGVQSYGVVAFSISIMQLSFIVTDYGFSLSATHEIAKKRCDKHYVNNLLGAVFLIKLGLCLLISTVIIIYAGVTKKYEVYSLVIYWTIFPILGQAFQPIWFFQGLEKMKYITTYTVFAKFTYLIFVVTQVKGVDDIIWVPISNGISQLLAALIGIAFIYKEGYKIVQPSVEKVFFEFKKSTQFFGSRVSVAIYTSGCAFMLGVFSTPQNVAIYSVAEQLYKAVQFAFMPLNQALYPYMSNKKNYKILFKMVILSFLALLFLALLGFFVAPYFLPLYLGSDSSVIEIIGVEV